MSSNTLSITNKIVFDFYKEHNLNFEAMNIIFVEVLRTMIKGIDNSKNNPYDLILDKITDIGNRVSAIDNNFSKINGDISSLFSLKLNEFKKDYMEDVKNIIHTNTTDKIEPLIKENSGILLDRTKLLMNEIIPKENEDITKNIGDIIEKFHLSVANDTEKLLNKTVDTERLDEFLKNLDGKFSQTIISTQNVINSLLTSSESRLDGKISEVKNSTQEIKNIKDTQNNLVGEFTKLLKKMENSSIKGKISENILNSILQELFPSGEIEYVGNQTAKGDIILRRTNKPTILIENKNYEKNVGKDEVNKFIRDVDENNCCGLFLSQNGGIANKDNLEFNFHNGNVLLYVHEANNDLQKIKFAIQIIDSVKFNYDQLNKNIHLNSKDETGVFIDNDTLIDINKDFQIVNNQKLALIKLAKEASQKIILQAEEIQMPSLEKYLSKKFAFSTDYSSGEHVCPVCKTFWKSKQSLSAHLRGCKNEIKNVRNTEPQNPVST